MEETISLQEIFQIIRKRILLIFSITFLIAIISGVISYYYLTPIYESSTQLLISQDSNEQQSGERDIETDLQLINTYNVIIKSSAILDLVKKELAIENMTTESLNNKINVISEVDSQVVTITVQDPDPSIARDIANTTADIFQREIVNLMNIDNVSILTKATASDGQEPVKPQPLLNVAISIVIGIMLSLGLAFLLEYLDKTIKSEQDIEKLLSLPVIGSISSMGTKEQKKIRKLKKKQLK
ncbi:MAG: Wzz/FepE/Etk N-terminal domain-containing protein, partial [Paenisporosarcina sp.]|nr:Wzz/FepE/Etk N-terminal domain-containing protein [Paenisporosarcina sp.]